MNKENILESLEYITYQKLFQFGLVLPPRECNNAKCNKKNETMQPYIQKRNKEAKNKLLYWRCSACGRSKTAFDESFFSLFKKSPRIIEALIKCWSGQLTIAKSISMIEMNLDEKVGKDVIGTLFYRLRQMCSLGIGKKSLELGGNGKIVEIDESLYARVKFNKGKDLKRSQVWVFGLVERNDPESKCYMTIVPDREAITLLQIIYTICRSGTIIYSDCWSSYNKICNLKNFKHQTVNHTYNFIDPDSGTCTNKIESLWRSCKQKFKEMNGCNRSMIQSYIDEYVWRYNNSCTTNRKLAFELIMGEISNYYKPGTDLKLFEENYHKCVPQDDEVFDFDSQSGSETGSEKDLDEAEFNEEDDLVGGSNDVEDEEVEDEEVEGEEVEDEEVEGEEVDDDGEEALVDRVEDEDTTVYGQSLTGSSTTKADYLALSDSVCDAEDISNDTEEESSSLNKQKRSDLQIYLSNEDQINKLNTQMANLACGIKKKAISCELESLEIPTTSSESNEEIKRALSNKKNPTPCPECGAYMEGSRGVKLHMSRSHKKV